MAALVLSYYTIVLGALSNESKRAVYIDSL
jgi:hypothetical protein